MTMENTKTVDEQFFEEAMKAIQSNDSDSMGALMSEPEDLTKEVIPAEDDKELDDKTVIEPEVTPAIETDEPSPNKDDLIAQLKAQLEEASAVTHKLKSDAGRVPALQRQLAALDTKLAEISANPKGASDKDATTFTPSSKALDVLQETDPELAAALRESMTSVYEAMQAESANRSREITQTFIKSSRDEQLTNEWNKLVGVVPNAKEVFGSSEWHSWVEGLSPGMRGLAESDYADDVLIALRQFSGAGAAGTASPTKVQEQRAARLTTKTPTSGAPTPMAGEPQDPEQLMNKLYSEMIAQQKRK